MRLIQKVAGIEEFMRVAETLSFARAAESLGQATSAVSKSIRLLESRLGTRLFHRTTRNVSLTDEGGALYARVSKWVAELDEIQSTHFVDQLTGLIRIDMPVTLGRVLFMPHLARFLDRHPKLTVEVRMNDHHVNLVAEGVDLALRIGELADSELVVKPLGKVKLGTYSCPQCLERYGYPHSPQDLLSHRLISFVPPSGRPKPMLYRQGNGEISIDTSRAVASFNNGEAMTDATIAGVGIAQFPTFHARKALEQGLLAQVLTGQDSPGPSIQLVYPSRKYLPKRVGVLIEFLLEELGETFSGEGTES